MLGVVLEGNTATRIRAEASYKLYIKNLKALQYKPQIGWSNYAENRVYSWHAQTPHMVPYHQSADYFVFWGLNPNNTQKKQTKRATG